MSMKIYALYGLGFNVTDDLIDRYVADAFNGHEDDNHFAWDVMDDFEALEFTKETNIDFLRGVVIQHLKDNYNCYENDGEAFDYEFISIDTFNGRILDATDCGCCVQVDYPTNIFKPMFESREELLKRIETSLPYIPDGLEWEKYVGWIEGTIYS